MWPLGLQCCEVPIEWFLLERHVTFELFYITPKANPDFILRTRKMILNLDCGRLTLLLALSTFSKKCDESGFEWAHCRLHCNRCTTCNPQRNGDETSCLGWVHCNC